MMQTYVHTQLHVYGYDVLLTIKCSVQVAYILINNKQSTECVETKYTAILVDAKTQHTLDNLHTIHTSSI